MRRKTAAPPSSLLDPITKIPYCQVKHVCPVLFFFSLCPAPVPFFLYSSFLLPVLFLSFPLSCSLSVVYFSKGYCPCLSSHSFLVLLIPLSQSVSLCFSLILCPFSLLSIPSYVLLPVPLLLFIPLSCSLSLFFLPPSVLPPITVFPPPFLLWGKVAIPEEKESSIQPAPGEQPLPPHQQDGRASGRPQGAAKEPETSICQQELPRRQRPRDVTHADARGSCWPGQRQSESCWGCRSGETDLPCLQGGLGVW